MTRGITLLAAGVLLALPHTAVSAQVRAVGDLAPVVTVPDLDGKPVRIGAAIGQRPALVEFWATWCEICQALLPRMVAAHQKYGDKVDFYGVNVTVNESRPRVKRYIAEHHLPFVAVYDEKGAAVRAFGAPATSYIVILDKTGHVSYIGSGADQNISAELAKVVGK